MKYSQEEKRLRLSHHTGSKTKPSCLLGCGHVGGRKDSQGTCSMCAQVDWLGRFLSALSDAKTSLSLAWTRGSGLNNKFKQCTLLVIRRS